MREEEERRKRGPSPRESSLIPPMASDSKLVAFLEHLFDDGMPQRLQLRVASGAGGRRLGPIVREVSYKPNAAKPTPEALVALSNEIGKLAREDCDAQGRVSVYAVLAYDLVRGDAAYSRYLFRVSPPDESQELAEMRGETFFDEGESSQKLVLDLLNEQRRHNRWLVEKQDDLLSVFMERVDAAEERNATMFNHMTKMVDSVLGMFGKVGETHVKYMTATEEMLSKADERKEKQEERAFRREKIEQGIQLVAQAVPHINEAIKAHREQKRLAAGESTVTEVKKPEPKNPVAAFLDQTTEEQDFALFGKMEVVDNETRVVEPGIFSEEQLRTLVYISRADEPEPKVVRALLASITPEQLERARAVVSVAQVWPVLTWLKKFEEAAA